MPTTYIHASELGLELNCDLMTGLNKTTGSAAADDAAAINAWLAGASAANPLCLILDGSACVSGIFGPAGGHWSIVGFGNDTGFFMKSASNNDVIHNGASGAANPSDPGGAAPARGANVAFRNFFINGHRNGNSTSGDPRGLAANGSDLWYYGINLMNLDRIVVENVRFYNVSAYNLRLSNCGDWIVDGCHFENFLPTDTVTGQNSDGLHVDGPSNDGRISNCFFRTGDDAIALNAPEGYSGAIVRTTITNCVSLQSQTMMRIYTTSQAPRSGSAAPIVDGLTVTNYIGSANVVGILIGLESARTITVTDGIKNISFNNVKITAPGFCWIQDNVGTISFNGCDWISGTRNEGMITGCTVSSTVDSLLVANCRMVRTPSGSSAAALFDNQNIFSMGAPGITFGRVLVNGFQVVDTDGFSGSAIAGLVRPGVTIGRLALAAVDSALIAAINNGGTVTATAGTLL